MDLLLEPGDTGHASVVDRHKGLSVQLTAVSVTQAWIACIPAEVVVDAAAAAAEDAAVGESAGVAAVSVLPASQNYPYPFSGPYPSFFGLAFADPLETTPVITQIIPHFPFNA
jgi:hypothetical protein